MPEMNEKLQELCNAQIDHELYASQLYLSMAAWFEDQGYDGMAGWMRAQSEEEREHALKFYDHLADRGVTIRIGGIDAPETSWGSPLEAFQDAYKHERKVTQQIYDIYNAVEDHGDFALRTLLNWFVDEQVEEEASTERIVELLERVGDDPYGLYKVDRELAGRTEA